MENVLEQQNKEYLKTHLIEADVVVDPETGEISKEYKHHKYVAGNPTEFFQLYASAITIMENDLKPLEAMIFVSTFKYANSGNQLALTKEFKQEIAVKNGVSFSAVANAITSLVNQKLLIRSSQSTYRINPRHFWKSNSQNRKKTLEYVIKIECPHC